MTEPEVRVESDRVKVDPGGEASIKVSIINPGIIVEGYRLTILGEAVKWTEVLPPEVSVYPKQESTSVVVFAPPSGAKAPGGVIPFGVKVQSTVDQGSRVVEGEVEVARQFGLQAVLRPVTSRGRWHGHHVLTVANWGNSAAQLRVVPKDPDDELGFLVKREVLEVPLGGVASSRISVRTRHPMLRGTLVRHPFEITCEPLGRERPSGPTATVTQPDRPIVNGALEQKPILTRTAVLVGTFILAAVVAGGTWLALHPPKVLERALLPAGRPPAPVLSAVGDPKDPTRPILLRDGRQSQTSPDTKSERSSRRTAGLCHYSGPLT